MKLTIIGSGNIGSALVSGLLRDRTVDPSDITLTDTNSKALAPFAAKGINTLQNNAEAVKQADMVILCVKPYLVQAVIDEIKPALVESALLVSLAAGISLEQLRLFAGERPLFRIIPNTAMAVCQSMTCVASENTNADQEKKVFDLLGRVGKVMKINESLMNAATVVASCGTAFILRYLHAATSAGVEIGLRPEVAEAMTVQTLLGAAVLMSESNCHPEEEIDKVTTPKGITIKGLNEMEHAGFSSSVIRGILAAYKVFDD